MTPKRPESALVVLYNQQHQVLVLRRNDDKNFWQSVTGSLEQDEVPVQTAIREVLEETGIELSYISEKTKKGNTVIDCRWVNQYSILKNWRPRFAPNVTSNLEYVFCAQVPVNVSIHLSEHSEFLWLPKADAINKVTSTTNKLAIAHFVPQDTTCKSF